MQIEHILWGEIARKSSAVMVIAGGSMSTGVHDGHQHTWSLGLATCQESRLLLRLLPQWCSSRWEARLCFLCCCMAWGGDTRVLAKGLCPTVLCLQRWLHFCSWGMGQDGWHFPCSFQLGYPRHCLSCAFSNPQCNPLFPYTHVCFLHPGQKVLDCASMAVLHRNHDRPWAPPVACVEVSPNKPSQDEQTRNCTECPRHGLRVTPIHIRNNSVPQYLLHSFSNDF